MDTEEKKYDQFTLEIHPDNSIRATWITHDDKHSFTESRVSNEEHLLEDINTGIAKLKMGELDGRKDDIQRIGRDLYLAIFTVNVGNLFEQALQTVLDDRLSGNKTRWLRLIIDVHPNSEVFNWPLEFLYCPSKGCWLATDKPLIALSRRHIFDGVFKPPVPPPLRVLFIISKPTKPDELKEKGVITTKVLEEIGKLAGEEPGQMEVQVLGKIEEYERQIQGIDYFDRPATYSDIRKLIDDWNPHVLHFIGHGKLKQGRGYLGLAKDEEGEVDWCSADDISQLFTAWQPRLVLLQACESALSDPAPGFMSLADHLIRRNIPAVIAMQFAVTNECATLFAMGFYEALQEGKEVDEAVQNGRFKISDRLRWTERHFGAPVLFTYNPGAIIQLPSSDKPLKVSENPGR